MFVTILAEPGQICRNLTYDVENAAKFDAENLKKIANILTRFRFEFEN